MKVRHAYGYTLPVSKKRRIELVTTYDRFFTTITLRLQSADGKVDFDFSQKKHFNWDLILPYKWAYRIGQWELDRRCEELAGIPFPRTKPNEEEFEA